MTLGISTTNTANAWINTLRGTSAATFTAVTTMFIQLHTGDPGASGTSNVANASTRQAINFAAASGGSAAITGSTAFTGTATETITHISAWGASTSGTFYWSAILTVAKAINSGDTLTLSTCTFALTPLAA